MKDETLVVLADYTTLAEAEISNSILRSAGIESFIHNEYMSGFTAGGVIPIQIVVREEDLNTAQQLLQHR